MLIFLIIHRTQCGLQKVACPKLPACSDSGKIITKVDQPQGGFVEALLV